MYFSRSGRDQDGRASVVDRFIGHLVERLLDQGMYDESLIIVTADHGASFFHGSRRQEISGDGDNAADVILAPLIVKLRTRPRAPA